MNIRLATINDIEALQSLNNEIQKLHVEKFPHIFKDTSSEEIMMQWSQFRMIFRN